MDWYLPGDDPASLPQLRHEIIGYLSRHAEPGADLDAAGIVVSELVSNAMRHTAGPVWIELEWLEDRPTLVVRDLGPGFVFPPNPRPPMPTEAMNESAEGSSPADNLPLPDVKSPGGRGLFLVTHLAADLAVAARRGGGAEVSAVLPVRRAASPSFPAPANRLGVLPLLSEASPAGGFSQPSFLRALVVQLSAAIERADGPVVAEQRVAEVGFVVGGQMEKEYRTAKEIVGRLSPEQMADCFVRLKHAIDGQFYVIEANDSRIVLGNHKCPFGNAVRNSPSLCRMTSSVFGGIAARNSNGEAAVVLEERIAVGDPQCRIVVHLGSPPASVQRFAHRYADA